MDLLVDDSIREGVNHRTDERKKGLWCIEALCRQKTLFMETKMGMYQSMVVLTLL